MPQQNFDTSSVDLVKLSKEAHDQAEFYNDAGRVELANLLERVSLGLLLNVEKERAVAVRALLSYLHPTIGESEVLALIAMVESRLS